MFSRKLSHLPCILILSLMVVSPAKAQVTTATFYGIVNDPSGAIVPGAEVTLVNENTSASLRTVTDSVGEFVFNFVAAGRYTLKISLPGFKTLESKSMDLGAGQNTRQAFTLQVGEVSESVTVTGESPLVNTGAGAARKFLALAGDGTSTLPAQFFQYLAPRHRSDNRRIRSGQAQWSGKKRYESDGGWNRRRSQSGGSGHVHVPGVQFDRRHEH